MIKFTKSRELPRHCFHGLFVDTASGGRVVSTIANPTYGSAGAVPPSPTHNEDEDGNVHV